MSIRLATVCVLLLILSPSALAQNANALLNLFGRMMQQAMVQATLSSWKKLPPSDVACIDQVLRQQGASVAALIKRGVMPSDPRLSQLRSDCRRQFAQAHQSAQPQEPPIGHSRPSMYVVGGLALGSHVRYESQAYQEYHCSPSEQSPSFIWCNRQNTEIGKHGKFFSSSSILHSQDGTVVYANRYVEPAFFGRNEVQREIDRLSSKFGERPREFRLPRREGFPHAVIAVWGKIELEQLSAEDVSIVASGGSPHKGLLVSFLGGLQRSAKRGVPVYRLAGGAGFLWAASFDREGRGNLRFLTIDASQIRPQITTASPTPLPAPPKPPPVATAPLVQAREFLDDAQAFVATQTSIKPIGEIARQAANLRLALDKFDEAAAIQSRKKLNDLLDPIQGFREFLQQRQAERQREQARRLAVASSEAEKNISFVDEYLRKNLADERTDQLLKQKDRLATSLKRRPVDEIIKENSTFQSYINNNGLADKYKEFAENYSKPPPSARPKGSLPDELGATEKSRSAIEGPKDDIILLYNASPSAPSVAKDILGKFVFLTRTASLCFAQQMPDESHIWFVERLIRGQGAVDVKWAPQPCNMANSAVSNDI